MTGLLIFIGGMVAGVVLTLFAGLILMELERRTGKDAKDGALKDALAQTQRDIEALQAKLERM